MDNLERIWDFLFSTIDSALSIILILVVMIIAVNLMRLIMRLMHDRPEELMRELGTLSNYAALFSIVSLLVWFITDLGFFESMLIALVVTFLAWIAVGIVRWLLEDLEEPEVVPRDRQELRRLHVPPLDRPPQPPPPPPPQLELFDLQLITEEGSKRNPSRGLSLYVNPKRVRAIRPVAFIDVNDQSLVGRRLPLKLILESPNGGKQYQVPLKPVLVLGENTIYHEQHEYPIFSRVTPKGKWTLQLWVTGTKLEEDIFWSATQFTITSKPAALVAEQVVSPDMEITPETERAALELEGATIDDLLE
jgi:hypothetical protein